MQIKVLKLKSNILMRFPELFRATRDAEIEFNCLSGHWGVFIKLPKLSIPSLLFNILWASLWGCRRCGVIWIISVCKRTQIYGRYVSSGGPRNRIIYWNIISIHSERNRVFFRERKNVLSSFVVRKQSWVWFMKISSFLTLDTEYTESHKIFRSHDYN